MNHTLTPGKTEIQAQTRPESRTAPRFDILKAARHRTALAKGAYVVRFSAWARIQHAAVIVLFTLLLVTGMPQKWPYAAASQWLIDALGGIFAVRWLHRACGVLFALLVTAHLATVIAGLLTRRTRPTLLFTRRDFADAIGSLRYYLGREPSPPKYGRYDYRQKFEYWGLIFGSLIMVVSGLVLYFPLLTARLLPAELIPAAKVMHSNEALLAMLIILVWHLYGAHLNPEVFPFDASIFSGKISKQRLEHEHALEYEDLFGTDSEATAVSELESEALTRNEQKTRGDRRVTPRT